MVRSRLGSPLRLALLAALGAGPALARPAQAPLLSYRVSLAPGLAEARVRVAWSGLEPGPLVLDRERHLALLALPRGLAPAPGGRGVVPAAGPAGAVEYVVDLGALAREGGGGDAWRVGGDLVTVPTRWLLRPARLPPGTVATLEADLPAGTAASVPWAPAAPREGERAGPAWRLDDTVWHLEGRAAFGRFRPEVLEVGGARIEVSVLDAPHRATRDGVLRWIREAARAVTTLHGRFPVPRAQVIVQPVPLGGRPVVFGTSRLGGGGGVLLHLSAAAGDDDLPGEWIAVHELAHLALPPVRREDAWFHEGLATWYQEVLRARAGLRTECDAWRALDDGFRRGRAARRTGTLAEASASMDRTHAYLRVYWSGAAIAWRWDAALRRATGGRRSLDDAVRMMGERLVGRPRLWSAWELVLVLDAWAGRPLFSEVAKPLLASAEFPPLEDLYAAMGLEAGPEGIRLDDAAPEAALRRAVTAPPARGDR